MRGGALMDGGWASPWRHLWAGLLLLLVLVPLHISERERTMTADEALHLVRGHVYWWDTTARFSVAHPPLANAITSSPFAGEGANRWASAGEDAPTKIEVLRSHSRWSASNPLTVALDYFRRDYAAALVELSIARHVMIAWTLLFAFGLYLWCERRWGFTTGILALALALTFPTLLAHGALVTTDLPAVATTTWGLMATIAWIERPSAGRMGLFALAASAMVLVKHSGPLYVLVLSLLMVICAWRGAGGLTSGSSTRRVLVTLGQLAAAALFVDVMLAAAYRFEDVGLTGAEMMDRIEPANWIARRRDGALLDDSLMRHWPDDLPVPFPYTWVLGIMSVSEQNELGHGRYFFGRVGQAWHPLYFPIMLFAKSPTGTLVLLGCALGLAWPRRRSLSLVSKLMAGFFLICLGLTCLSRINIGVRHAMPLLPVMIIVAARAGAALWNAEPTIRLRARSARALVGACLVANVGGAAWTFDDWIADFNFLVGGARGGHFISVVGEDWGQDLDELAEALRAEGHTKIRYHTSFPLRRTELEQRGIRNTRLRCDEEYRGSLPMVIHRSDWVRRRTSCFAWIEREPDLVLHHHFLVFLPDPERTPPAAPPRIL